MAARKLLSVGQFPFLNNSLNILNPLKKDYSKKKLLESMGVPLKPKKPPSSFLIYQMAQRVEVTTKNPGKSFGEITKIIAAKWRSLLEAEKSKYVESFEEKLSLYKSQMQDYIQNYGDLRKKDIKKVQKTVDDIKTRKKVIQKLNKENNKPEFPSSNYKFFVQENMRKMDLPMKSRLQKCAELWKNMSEKEKENFNKMYQQKYDQYKNELQKWEENMIKQGKSELVRPETLKEKFSNK